MKMTYRMYAIEEELAELSYLNGNIETPQIKQSIPMVLKRKIWSLWTVTMIFPRQAENLRQLQKKKGLNLTKTMLTNFSPRWLLPEYCFSIP